MILHGSAPLTQEVLPADQRLPVLLLSQYLLFLTRRPISEANLHFLTSRLRALQSLEAVFAGSGHPVLDRVVRQLRQLHPAAFRRLGAALQLSLIPLVRGAMQLPGDVVVQDSTPPADWMKDIKRALVVFGPGIGIGDELILTPLPAWLKTAADGASVTTLSGYRGFWDRVEAVDHARQYSSNLDILTALRGVPPYDEFDLVVFVDFEAPELYRALASDARRKTRYLEISVGARSAFYFDAERRWLYRLHHVTPYFTNYYHALHQTLMRLGLSPHATGHFNGFVTRREQKASDRLDVFVTPFTSKYDPSVAYWGRLLSAAAQHPGPYPVCLHLDTGNTWRTQRFAIELARGLAATVPSNVEVRLASDRTPPALSLPHVYDYLDRCHAIICADSFAAHAGPLFDCLTLVLAKSDLTNWRVPFEKSFYFDTEWPLDRCAEAIGALLCEVHRPKSPIELAAHFSKAELDLSSWGGELAAVIHRGQTLDDGFGEQYRRFADHHRVVRERRQNGHGHEVLFADSFSEAIQGPGLDWDDSAAPGMRLHLRDQVERWQNTNFAKYVRWAAKRSSATAAEAPVDANVDHPMQPGTATSQLATVLLAGMKAILREQLPTGEIGTYFRVGAGALEYRRTPLVSAFVHDALGGFDLKSRWVDTDVLDALPTGTQGRFVRAAALVRSRIRRFLLWEEGNGGGWWFNGRASGGGADPDTTACAAAAVLQAPRRQPSLRWRAHAAMAAGPLNDHDAVDFAGRVNVLRYLALIGEPVEDLAASVVEALRRRDASLTSRRYAQPLVIAYCVARAWAHARLPDRHDVAAILVPAILDLGNETPNFGGPLGTALALNALLDLEYSGSETIGAAQYLLDSALPRGGWNYGAFLEHEGGAPALSTALAMSALARSNVGR
jgi:hypothetical protein